MMLFASILSDPAAIAGWLGAGLAIGWLTRTVSDEPSYGTMGDVIIGTVSGFAGGLLYSLFISGAGFWGGTLAALVAAIVVVVGVRVVMARQSS